MLLCAAHHRAVHSGQWAITITGGVVHVTRPTWTTPGITSAAELANLTELSRYYTSPVGGQVSVNPNHEHPDRLATTSLTQEPDLQLGSRPKVQAGTGDLSWLTPEATALLDPWGDSGTPSAGP